MREQLEARERQGRGHDERLDSVKVPDGFEYLWQMFWDLRSGLEQGFSGAKITWRAILDYQEVTGYKLSAWEIEAVRAMDITIAKWREDNKE